MKEKQVKADPVVVLSVLYLFILVAPWFLLLLRLPLLYSVLVEELIKLAAVVVVTSTFRRGTLYWVFLVGALFGASESALFLLNVNFFGNMVPWLSRWLLTVPMHIVTVLMIYGFSRKGRIWLILGYVFVVVFHYGFNLLVQG